MTRPLRTLLVEDNPADARLLKELFLEVPRLRIALTHVVRLAEATALLERESFDLLLLDLSLPDASGASTVARAHAAAPGLPIVVLTGLDDDDAALEAMKRGAQDYLVKGVVTPDLFARAVRYAVERKNAEEGERRLAREQAARAAAESSSARWRLLAEVSEELTRSMDLPACVGAAARRLVPALGASCVIEFDDEPGSVRLASHSSEMEGTVASPPREKLEVPVIGRSRTLGAVTLWRPAGVTWSEDEVGLVQELARRLGMAVENAQLYRAREDVIGVVSHDLRNPLNLITLALPLLEGAADTGARAGHLHKIRRALDRINRLIDDLLDVSRIEADSLPMARQKVESHALLSDTWEMLRPLGDERKISMVRDIASDLPAIVADRERLQQVIANLVGNAVKFTPSGGRITLTATANGEEIRVEVIDTGSGIRPEDVGRVFDRFWQGGRGTRQGAGLGLAIARGIVVAHGGKIGVDSQPGTGSTFWFTIPAPTPAAAPAPAPSRLAGTQT